MTGQWGWVNIFEANAEENQVKSTTPPGPAAHVVKEENDGYLGGTHNLVGVIGQRFMKY